MHAAGAKVLRSCYACELSDIGNGRGAEGPERMSRHDDIAPCTRRPNRCSVPSACSFTPLGGGALGSYATACAVHV